ncbi:MFS general substrate transporter [Xylona heveae TC161]|uniref:MFS general substrate transporter n=1 Tax=Xylona heveae (strain CBS 132557 / TC161) TaxID=1328760 RepID=A0A165HBV0_XYLHT|nr:MFS general substrate transporter [Xylona heveae TC161]KZF23271.1 MFS general substrate transporter [Xylona heveae TC161]
MSRLNNDYISSDEALVNADEGATQGLPLQSLDHRVQETEHPGSGETLRPRHSYEDDDEPDDEYFKKSFHEHDERERLSVSSADSFTLYTPDEENEILRIFNRRLVAFSALLYMLSFLDRSNIGNARIAGLANDLHLDSAQYEWLLTAFYLTYITFEWMTLLYRVVPAHIYVAVCVLSWGIIASLQSLATSFAFLVFLRALLGIGEAAFAGVPFYLSFFFKRDELAQKIGLFISAAPLATSFAGTLAWVITRAAKNGPIAPWRLLFLIEGFPSVIAAAFTYICLPDGPGKAKFLNRRQRRIAEWRLRREQGSDSQDKDAHKGPSWGEIVQILKDPKCYLPALMAFSCNVAFSSMPVFLPTILTEMGYSSLSAQGLAAPPYLLSFIVVLITSTLSDRLHNRSIFIIFHSFLSFLGYALITVAGLRGWSAGWRYAAVYPATIGFFSAITCIIAWTINNQDSAVKKGMGMTILNVVAQCGPLIGTRLYPDEDGPLYLRGMSICAGFMLFVALLAVTLRMLLLRENRKLDEQSKADYIPLEVQNSTMNVGNSGARTETTDRSIPLARRSASLDANYNHTPSESGEHLFGSRKTQERDFAAAEEGHIHKRDGRRESRFRYLI